MQKVQHKPFTHEQLKHQQLPCCFGALSLLLPRLALKQSGHPPFPLFFPFQVKRRTICPLTVFLSIQPAGLSY